MVMMWMEFECEVSFVAKTPETRQHLIYSFGVEFSVGLTNFERDGKLFFWRTADYADDAMNSEVSLSRRSLGEGED
jgi:hypothetical protein